MSTDYIKMSSHKQGGGGVVVVLKWDFNRVQPGQVMNSKQKYVKGDHLI